MTKKLIYMENWDSGMGGWSNALSRAAAPSNTPTRIFVNQNLARFALYSSGNLGWAIKANEPPVKSGELEIRFYCMPMAKGRNILSLNVRDKNGNPIYKYSFGHDKGGFIAANKQGASGAVATLLTYEKQIPYELISNHVIGSDTFTLSLRNLLDDTIQVDPTVYIGRGTKAAPCGRDMDGEGNTNGPAYIGKIEVWKI